MSMFPKELDNPEAPLFPIGVVAELLEVTDQTLRVYEKSGFIRPLRRNKDRYYSANDVVWLKCLRRFLKKEGINFKGIGKLLRLVPCYEISPCEECGQCTAHLKRGLYIEHAVFSSTDKRRKACRNCPRLIQIQARSSKPLRTTTSQV